MGLFMLAVGLSLFCGSGAVIGFMLITTAVNPVPATDNEVQAAKTIFFGTIIVTFLVVYGAGSLLTGGG